LEVYSSDESRMIADFNNERETIKEYNGRQILELLQNADDEESEEVFIKLDTDKKTLTISNNGYNCKPFSAGGIKSLMLPNYSPKKGKKYIGNKGLGFRSIVNWSQQITIYSQDLKMDFSYKIAKEIYGDNTQNKIAFLSLPKIQKYENRSWITSIEIYYKDEYLEDIKQQLLNIKDEVLLFVNNINELSIDIDGELNKIERIKYINQIYLNNILWEIFEYDKHRTLLPERYWENDEKEYFDLKIAINENFDNRDNLLYSFFPTEISIDFPFVIHGTFELDSSRNNINISDKNSYILEKLVEFIVDTAKELIKNNVSYKALEFLTHNNSNHRLDSLNFYKNIDNSIAILEIFPCIDNTYRKKDKVVFISSDFSNFIERTNNQKLFPNMLKSPLNTNIDLDDHGIDNRIDDYYIIDTLSKNINNIDDRVELINLISKNFEKNNFELLIDENERIINKNDETYTPITKDYDFCIPSFVKIKFINNSLYTKLLKQFNIDSNEKSRDLQRELKNITNIQSYEPAQILQKIITSTNKELDNKTNKIDIVKEMVLSLYENYKILGEKTKIPENTKVQLINKEDTLINAKDLFLSKTYPSGKLTEELFNDIFENNNFLTDVSKFNFKDNEDIQQIERFFLWLGVNKHTKFDKITSDYKYSQYLLNKFGTPQSYSKFVFDMPRIANIEIIKNIKIEKILLWLLKDNELKEEFSKEHKILYVKSGGYVHHPFTYNAPAYLLFQIYTLDIFKDYLITNDKLSPLVNKIKIDFNHKSFKNYGINIADIESLILKVGAIDKIEDISIGRVQEILKDLEDKSPDGKQTQVIYKAIRNHKQPLNDTSIKLCAKKNGLLGYYEQNEIFYVNTTKLPKKIIDNIPIINIPPRLGNVIKFYGIKDIKDIQIKILEYEENKNITKLFNDFIEQVRPYILVYRFDELKDDNTKKREISKLKNSKIILCDEVIYRMNKDEYTLDYNDYVKENKQYFIKIENKLFDDIRITLDFRDTFADIIGSIFNIANIEKFTRLISDDIDETEEIIKRKFGYDAILEAREYLDIADEFSTFWRTVYKLKNSNYQKELINEVRKNFNILTDIDTIDYINITSNQSCEILQNLFKELNITVEDFNNSTSYYKLDFQSFHKENLENSFHKNFNNFEKILYKWCIDNKKEEKFIDLIGKYENVDKSNIDNLLFVDYQDIVNSFIQNSYEFTLEDEKTEIDYKRIYEKNKSNIALELELNNQEKSFLYFQNKFDDLKKILKTKSDDLVRNKSYTNHDNTIPTDVQQANFGTPSKPNITSSTTNYGNYSSNNDNAKKQKGDKAEQCVYNWLINRYGKSKVKWFAKESDTGHYDIRYEKEENKWVYVEVKTYSNNMFYLSKDEKKFAEKNKSKYEIFFVKISSDKKCENTQIYFEENIDFTDTTIFSLVPNKYEVYYKIKVQQNLGTNKLPNGNL